MEMDQVKAGGRYFFISLYINSVLRTDIEINWVINAYYCMGPSFCISIMESFFLFLSLYQNIQDKHMYKLNDLWLWYPLLKVQMSFIVVIYPFGFIHCSRHCVSKYCLLYSQLCSAWLDFNTPKQSSYSNPFSSTECLGFFFSPVNSSFSTLYIWEGLYLYNCRYYIVFSLLFRKRFDIVGLIARPTENVGFACYTYPFK